jgi:hypothetical protein
MRLILVAMLAMLAVFVAAEDNEADAGYWTWNGIRNVYVSTEVDRSYWNRQQYHSGSHGFTYDSYSRSFSPAYRDYPVQVYRPRSDINPNWWYNYGQPTSYYGW